MKYSREELLEMHKQLLKARLYTLKMHEAVNAGYIRSSFHSPHGQEAIAVGAVLEMDSNDWLGPTHREQCGSIMRFDTYEFIAEICGKRDGMAKGVAFDYHCTDYREGKRMLGPLGCLGGSIPTYAGFAFALKEKGSNEVAVIFNGEGACSEGEVYEGWNLMALYKVPMVHVISNNEWGMTVPLERQSANPNIAEKAEACGLPIQIADGNDIFTVRETMRKAIDMARNGQPNVVEFKTLRWEAHFIGQGDDYREGYDLDKVEEYKEKYDCLKNLQTYLKEENILDETEIENITKEVHDELDAMLKRAAEAPLAERDEVYVKEQIYATPETGGDL